MVGNEAGREEGLFLEGLLVFQIFRLGGGISERGGVCSLRTNGSGGEDLGREGYVCVVAIRTCHGFYDRLGTHTLLFLLWLGRQGYWFRWWFSSFFRCP